MTLQKYRNLFFFYPYIILGILFLLCILVWPLRLLGHTSYERAALDRGITGSIDLSGSAMAAGEFTSFKEHLESISFQFIKSSQAQEGTAVLELYNSAQTPVTTVSLDIADIKSFPSIADMNFLSAISGSAFGSSTCTTGWSFLGSGFATDQ